MAFSLLFLFLTSSYCWCAFGSLMPMVMAMAAPPCGPPAPDPQVSALLTFKAALTCYNSSNCVLSTWELPSLADPCLSTNISHPCTDQWAGIACQSHRVVALNLSHCDLGGTISPSLAHLPFLSSLDLSHNRLMGGIPTELGNCSSLIKIVLGNNFLQGRIPLELGMLNKLQVLDIAINNLTGVIPGAIANCTALTTVMLSMNQVSGPIPVELNKLSELQTLYLWGNQLTGEIPNALGNCTSLANLGLMENDLSGRIPGELGMLKELQRLGFWGNKLTGEIPVELGMLKKLRLLELNHNELVGGIPIALRNCTSLTILALNGNNLSGLIPVELGMLKEVQLLYLWGNQLTGGILKALGNCTSLIDLELAKNDLSGPIPVELGMLNELQRLFLWGNQLTGEIPYALGNCTSLTILELLGNHLSGRIPLELGTSGLQTLSLGSNGLSGSLPSTLANCTALVALLVYSNSLSGTIPDVFDGLSSLGEMDLSENSFSGVLPRSLGSVKKLYKVHLQGNALVGTIPDRFFLSAPSLAFLDISNNNLSGLIPESFGKLIGLVQLHLSHNHLNGTAPPGLGSFPQLLSLDLSWNALSGEIPASLGQGTLQLQSLDLSHNNFTGLLPASFASLQSLLLLNLSYNQLEGPVPNAFPYSSTSTLVDLRGNPLLCGKAVNRSCTPTTDRRASQHSKLFISAAGAFCLVGLLMIGIVIIWKQRSKHSQRSKSNDANFRTAVAVKVSAEELQVATNNFSEDCILGQGGSSIVYRGILAGYDVPVAIKVLKSGQLLQTVTKAQVARSKREVEVLATVRHRNIVKVLGCCFNLDVQAIILELMPNGNLDTYLHRTSRQNAPSKEAKLRLLRGIAQGLEYLHHWHDPSQSIVHCDVKPANILLDEDWEPRIADFGIAKLLQHAGTSIQAQQGPTSVSLRGSVGYIPPEYAFKAEVSTAGDVYSFGVVMLEVLTGKRPTDVHENGADHGKHDSLMSLVQAAYPEHLVPLFTDETLSWHQGCRGGSRTRSNGAVLHFS